MALNIILFLIGFYILIRGSDILIDGGRSIARWLNISSWVIGITIVGIGTSIPEFSITLLDALNGEAALGFGTIIGSNTFNILLILGLVAIIYPITVQRRWVWEELTTNVFAVLSFALMAVFPVFGGGYFEISPLEALAFLVMFIIWIFREATKNGVDGKEDDISSKIYALHISFVMVLGGLVGVLFGAKWVVDGGVAIARYFGTSEAVIGLTIVGIGTSLPELAVSLRAAYKKNFGISLGNIVGSNIFDFWGIVGVAGIFGGLKFPRELLSDLAVTLFAASLLLVMMFVGRLYVLKRWQGAVMVVLYIIYLTYIF